MSKRLNERHEKETEAVDYNNGIFCDTLIPHVEIKRVRIPRATYTRLVIRAEERKRHIDQLITEAIESYLS